MNKKVAEIYGIDSLEASDSHGAEVEQISGQLREHANRMLLDYLRKTRQSRRKASASQSNPVKNPVKEHAIDQVSSIEFRCGNALIPLCRPLIHVSARF